MSGMSFHEDFDRWMTGLDSLTSTRQASDEWRRYRYAFAHRLGTELAGATETSPPVVGSAVYGIWLRWGLLYVGQTTDASRRLRDLPVGESHNVANTFPPETWDRVVVVNWRLAPEADPAVTSLGEATVGLALEHALQLRVQPLANSARRTTDGGWRPIDRARSRSRGAVAAPKIRDLETAVRQVWDMAAHHEAGDPPLPAWTRCVRPREVLARMRAENGRSG